MNIKSKGYELELSGKEARTLHKVASKITGNMKVEMGLTTEEIENFHTVYRVLSDYFNKEQI